ncbi:hypothetical protein E2C01_017053 [Portunus trituberculatus]|uniref:Uncharacterized protein n=1 Tax=Portunus trituberculatus TaxID=210409 RepID=A0A5B7DSC2_PORTR|nr:hypothetical protein [Portunus trituberculatus]
MANFLIQEGKVKSVTNDLSAESLMLESLTPSKGLRFSHSHTTPSIPSFTSCRPLSPTLEDRICQPSNYRSL